MNIQHLETLAIVVACIYVTMPLAIYITWLQYLAVMNLQRARDTQKLTKPAYYMGLPMLYIGLFCDFTVNVVWVTFLFLDPPRELLITGRLERYVRGPDGWRKRLAQWFAANMLDPFDPRGIHVKP
jgi:hypothetical protein